MGKIEALCQKAAVKSHGNVYQEESLDDDLHGNASVNHNQIMLGKSLLEKLSDDEILGVLCHEIGHLKMHH